VKLVPFARIVGVFGVRGELKCTTTSAGQNVLSAGKEYALDAEGRRKVRCIGVRRQQNRQVLALDNVTTPEAARALVGSELFAERSELKLEPDEFLDDDLIGLRLFDIAGDELGTVVGVEHLPAQDCLVVGPKRALVPLVSAFVRSIDLDRRAIVVDLPAGLLD
jgi:16S rRNA processing protein RimM